LRVANPADDLRALLGGMRDVTSPFQMYLSDLHESLCSVTDGVVANYIPELAHANPNWLGICVATVDGRMFAVGDADQPFTIQSVSKPFMYGLALEDNGREQMLARVGVEPTGDAFNAIVLDEATNRPYNPMVNAGAIAVAGQIAGADPTERLNRVLAMFERYAGRPILMDAAVFTSERTTGHRNRAIAYLMRNFGMIGEQIDQILDLYFQQCSLLVTCRDLAMMGATLANDGVNPLSGAVALDRQYVGDVLSVMYTCGMYDYSGEWAYKVGMPAKSGVGGGIVAVVPGRLGIGVFAPRIDARGNSVCGVRACIALAERYGLHIFKAQQRHDLLAADLDGKANFT
jgi:glutaminase